MADSTESGCERFDISVLVVDDDTTTLSVIYGILRSWEYQVMTATNCHEALKTLREFRGIIDIVITDLHMRGMNGFELQKLVKLEFNLPVIMMSADSRKSVMSKSLASGAVFYIVKPVNRDDFKDIWQYAVAARKQNSALDLQFLGNKGGVSSMMTSSSSAGEKSVASEDVNAIAPFLAVSEPKRRRKYRKRKGGPLEPRSPKKPKVVWSTALHNRFLLAIRQIGLNKAVPKKILEIMNVPGLTRENVASHLQKYRIFLRRVAEKGILEGLSERALRSRFASGLPTSLIQSVQRRIAHFRLHHHHHPRPAISHPATPTTTTTTAISLPQLPYNPSTTTATDAISPTSNRASLINQVRLGQPNYFGIGTSQSHHTGYSQPTQHRPFLPAYNRNGGFLTSANALTGNQSMTITNYATASLGVNNINNTFNFNYGSGFNSIDNNNERSFVPFGSSSANYNYPTSNYKHSAIQLNNNASLVPAGRHQNRSVGYTGNNNGVINNNTFGLISNGSFGNNANVPAASSVFNNGHAESSAPGNISGLLPPLTQHSNNGNGKAGDDVQHQLNNNRTVNSLSESEASQLDENLTELFLMMDDMHLLNETGENPRSELLNSDILSPFHGEQFLEQLQVPSGHVTVSTPTSEGNSINVLTNKSPAGADESSNQQLSDDVSTNLGPLDMNLADKAKSSVGIYSAAEQDWDMELIESLFGTVDSNQKE